VVPGVLCAAARAGCPVVVNVLECVHPGYTGLRGALLRRYTKKWANGFVFMLPSEARRWGLLGAPTCVSVFDFIDLTLFTAPPGTELRTAYHVPPDTALIGYLGRFTNAKGVHLLVQALGELKRKGVKFHALLIGPVPVAPPQGGSGWLRRLTRGTPYIERVRALIAAEGLEHEVTFTGERLDATRLANQFDVVAVPFIEPHFSRLCAEAAAAGVVAVAFNIDGPGEEIIDGQTGLLATPFDAHDLAAKIAHALAHPAERRAMGDAARRRAAEVFDAEKNIAAVLALYRQLGV
jgi:glycosyltransferase involved in cell wall biosynthesis